MTIAIRDLPAKWRVIGDPVVIADASVATEVQPVVGSDGIFIITETQDIRVATLPLDSDEVATATLGWPIATTDGMRFVPLVGQKASIIEQVAGADVQYQRMAFLD